MSLLSYVYSWKDVIGLVPQTVMRSRRNAPRSKLVPRNGLTYSITCARFQSLSPSTIYGLTDSRHMMDMIPIILQKQRTQVRDEIQEKDISIIFDGTTRLREVLVVVCLVS